MSVLKLVEYSCKDTISILKVLLSMALKGQLRGLVICYRTDDGEQRTVYTGAYKANPVKAAGATLHASLTLMRAHGEVD